MNFFFCQLNKQIIYSQVIYPDFFSFLKFELFYICIPWELGKFDFCVLHKNNISI